MKSSEITNPLDNAFSLPQMSPLLNSLILVPMTYFFSLDCLSLTSPTAKLREIRVESKE